ncbi:unnamed protein product [Effrenium voratum]|nr:unnamed protein product [Effrenium voratum]
MNWIISFIVFLTPFAAGSFQASADRRTSSAVNITVTSAGFKSGSFATFEVNGETLPLTSGRGLNVVVLEKTGVMQDFRVFDTFNSTSESAAFATFMNGLADGTLVAIAVRSDASSALTTEAKDAVAACGGTQFGDLGFQDSWALVCLKGGPSVAEAYRQNDAGPAAVSYTSSATATTSLDAETTSAATSPATTTSAAGTGATTTTTTLAPCGLFLCPVGSVLDPELLSSPGSDADACCTANDESVDVGVQSAGYDDGNQAVFFAAGTSVFAARSRGITVVVLQADLRAKSYNTFDTLTEEGWVWGRLEVSKQGACSDELEAFLNALEPSSDLILMGVRDEGSIKLSAGAKAAIKSCGGTMIDSLGFRDAYALIGRKNGTALAEAWQKRSSGFAVAVTRRPAIKADTSAVPICDAKVAAPAMRGTFPQNQLQLDAGCRYALWETPGALGCLQGRWVVHIGTSNTILWWIQFANFLHPGAIRPIRDDVSLGQFRLADLVIDQGVITYQKAEMPEDCLPKVKHDSEVCKAAKAALLSAPSYSPTAVRLTLIIEHYWPNTGSDLDLLQAASSGAWGGKMAVNAHVVTHYVYCMVMKDRSCTMAAYKQDVTQEENLGIFRAEMEPVADKLQAHCGPEAAFKDCTVATATVLAWQDPRYNDFQDVIRDVMASRGSRDLRLLDLALMGQSMPGEAIRGHGSPVNFLWAVQILLNGMCPLDLAASGNFAKFEGPTCHATDVANDPNFDNCPEYRDQACGPDKTHHWCMDWECAADVPCKMVATGGSIVQANLTGACFRNLSVSFEEQTASSDACFRVWCLEAAEVPITLVALLPALFLLAWMWQWPQRLRRCCKAKQEPKEEPVEEVLEQPVEEEASDSKFASVTEATLNKSATAPVDVSPRSKPDMDRAVTVHLGGGVMDEVVPDEQAADAGEIHAVMAEPSAAKPAPKTPPKAGDKFPLGLARFIAAVHVVLFHLYAEGVTPDVYLFGWGFTWVPWFFMLSGFVLGNGHECRPNKDGILQYTERRLVTVYPLYASTLLPALVIAKGLGVQKKAVVLAAQTWLLQAWNPEWPEHALGAHCWFLSAMLMHFLLFKPLTWCFDRLALRGAVLTVCAVFALPWLAVIIPEALQARLWYADHHWGETDSTIDLVVIFVKFNPICYVHIFALGMLMAKIRKLVDGNVGGLWCRIVLESLLPASIVGLLLVFMVKDLRPWGYQITTQVGLLLPLQATVILGLAGLPSLPLPYLAQKASHLDFLEPYAFSYYLFQGLAYSLWPRGGYLGGSTVLFLLFLFGISVISVHMIQKPAQSLWTKYPNSRRGVPVLLTLLLVGLNYIPAAGPGAFTGLEAEVRHDAEMVDVRLPLTDPADDLGGVLINPSLFIHEGEVKIAVRRHHLESWEHIGEHNGSVVHVIEQIWHSRILLGSVSFDAGRWAEWPKTGVAPFAASEVSAWTGLRSPSGQAWRQLCVRETFLPENNTLLRKVTTGPEDPKLLYSDGLAVLFNSIPPRGRDGCAPAETVSQMYLAHLGASPAVETTGQRLGCGFRDQDEKNWIPFAYQGKLHLIYTPGPHKVVAVDSEGCRDLYETAFEPLKRLQERHPELKARGSGQAVLVNGTHTPNLPYPHYLALLHLAKPSTGEYKHFAYRFSAEPPFAMLQISSELPLQTAAPARGGAVFAFGSGLLLQDETVVISYGAGDLEPRALVMNLQRLDDMFGC